MWTLPDLMVQDVVVTVKMTSGTSIPIHTPRRRFNARAMREAVIEAWDRFREHSHTRITIQPSARKSRVTARSRRTLRSSFGSQYSSRERGECPCFGQQCQKHPSTKSATRSRRQTKSGEPWRRIPRLQPVKPAARNRHINRSSVVALRVLRTRDMMADRRSGVKTSTIFS